MCLLVLFEIAISSRTIERRLPLQACFILWIALRERQAVSIVDDTRPTRMTSACSLLACLASIQPRTSLVKFARSPFTDYYLFSIWDPVRTSILGSKRKARGSR